MTDSIKRLVNQLPPVFLSLSFYEGREKARLLSFFWVSFSSQFFFPV